MPESRQVVAIVCTDKGQHPRRVLHQGFTVRPSRSSGAPTLGIFQATTPSRGIRKDWVTQARREGKDGRVIDVPACPSCRRHWQRRESVVLALVQAAIREGLAELDVSNLE